MCQAEAADDAVRRSSWLSEAVGLRVMDGLRRP